MRWPWRSKYFRKDARISLGCTRLFYPPPSVALARRWRHRTGGASADGADAHDTCAGLEALRDEASDDAGHASSSSSAPAVRSADGARWRRPAARLRRPRRTSGRPPLGVSSSMPSCRTRCRTRRAPAPAHRASSRADAARHARIVERAIGRVSRSTASSMSSESHLRRVSRLAQLRLGQLAPGEQRQCDGVGVHRHRRPMARRALLAETRDLGRSATAPTGPPVLPTTVLAI